MRYLFCQLSECSIGKSTKETGVSIKISFDSVSVEEFLSIVESKDLFYAYPDKGKRNFDRLAKKRGEKAVKRRISIGKVSVVATCERSETKILR